MKLYVGNLPPTVNDKELEELFSSFGEIVSAKVIIDRDTGRSKRFGFVQFATKEAALSAIESMDKKVVGKEPITVNEARPLERRDNRDSPFKKNYR